MIQLDKITAIESENAVLSTFLIKHKAHSEIYRLTEEHFYVKDNAKIFKAIKKIIEDDKKVDISTLSVELKGEVGKESLTSLLTNDTTFNLNFHIDEIIKNYKTRKIYNVILDYKDQLENHREAEIDLNKIEEALEDKTTTNSFTSLKDIKNTPLDDIFTPNLFVRTGLFKFDNFYSGFGKGQLITLGARPGCGKTTLALQIATSTPAKPLFFSLEMIEEEIYAKILSAETDISSNKIEQTKLDENEMMTIMNHHDKKRKDIIIQRNTDNFNAIINSINYHIKNSGIEMIIIDYLQLITSNSRLKRHEMLSEVTRSLKKIAQRHKIPVLILSQLNRLLDRENRKPTLADLKDSGSIEQDSDVVMLLCEAEEEKRELFSHNLIIAKNRKGRVGKMEVNFIKEFSKFKDI